uniref:Uncharacterized protein n=1 Tax=Molossus molossus TaxID=27622 RepID=A0A7J8J767_MOLMO|nr:hypothetical protein HJG59_009705 [Molossus molossus]
MGVTGGQGQRHQASRAGGLRRADGGHPMPGAQRCVGTQPCRVHSRHLQGGGSESRRVAGLEGVTRSCPPALGVYLGHAACLRRRHQLGFGEAQNEGCVGGRTPQAHGAPANCTVPRHCMTSEAEVPSAAAGACGVVGPWTWTTGGRAGRRRERAGGRVEAKHIGVLREPSHPSWTSGCEAQRTVSVQTGRRVTCDHGWVLLRSRGQGPFPGQFQMDSPPAEPAESACGGPSGSWTDASSSDSPRPLGRNYFQPQGAAGELRPRSLLSLLWATDMPGAPRRALLTPPSLPPTAPRPHRPAGTRTGSPPAGSAPGSPVGPTPAPRAPRMSAPRSPHLRGVSRDAGALSYFFFFINFRET